MLEETERQLLRSSICPLLHWGRTFLYQTLNIVLIFLSLRHPFWRLGRYDHLPELLQFPRNVHFFSHSRRASPGSTSFERTVRSTCNFRCRNRCYQRLEMRVTYQASLPFRAITPNGKITPNRLNWALKPMASCLAAVGSASKAVFNSRISHVCLSFPPFSFHSASSPAQNSLIRLWILCSSARTSNTAFVLHAASTWLYTRTTIVIKYQGGQYGKAEAVVPSPVRNQQLLGMSGCCFRTARKMETFLTEGDARQFRPGL